MTCLDVFTYCSVHFPCENHLIVYGNRQQAAMYWDYTIYWMCMETINKLPLIEMFWFLVYFSVFFPHNVILTRIPMPVPRWNMHVNHVTPHRFQWVCTRSFTLRTAAHIPDLCRLSTCFPGAFIAEKTSREPGCGLVPFIVNQVIVMYYKDFKEEETPSSTEYFRTKPSLLEAVMDTVL